MTDSCVIAVYRSLQEAQRAVHILRRAEFPQGQMMLIGSSDEQLPRMIADLSMGDDSVHDAATGRRRRWCSGRARGRFGGRIVGIAVVFVAGSLVGGLAGALVGAFVGSLAGWGVHSSQVAHYEKYLKSGKALVIAEGDPLEAAAR